MIKTAAILSIVIMIVLLVRDIRRSPAERIVLAPFWYFSFLFIFAFPIRSWLIDSQSITLQAQPLLHHDKAFSDGLLLTALMFSFILWVAVYIGRHQTTSACIAPPQHLNSARLSQERPLQIFIAVGVIALISIAGLILIGPKNLTDFNGLQYQSSRLGSGFLWLLPEFILYAVFAFAGWLITRRHERLELLDVIVLLVIIGITFWVSGALYTRRIIAGGVLAVVILAMMRKRSLWPLGMFAVFATVFASLFLDMIRLLAAVAYGGQPADFIDMQLDMFINRPLQIVTSSFEGVDHVARLLDKASATELLVGVDQGLSWLFNAGLALVPRAIWASKPVIYGGTEQLHWLYPDLFTGNFSSASIPTSFVVDFSFAFGLPFALVMAYVFGRLLGASERTFWDRASHSAQVALSLFIFVYMFNWVRGGTIIVQSVMLFSIPAALIFGLRPVLQAAFGLAGEAVGLVGGKWWGTTRVFFYPHTYLRDRQLDTVRHWPGHEVVNADIAAQRSGAQVDQDQSLAPSRPSWKSVLPLVNIKRRPQGVPNNAATYVWGGLIAKGPFITDIDNPYAFTGYNTLAVKLYRPIIQAFLESPRCLQIRCLSQACLEGVRREYGEGAAAKAQVAYPVIKPAVTMAPPQLPQKCRFLFVSTQFEIKGGEALLKAFAQVVKTFPGAELDLVTHLPERFKALSDETANVRVHRADLSRNEIAERFLKNADVLVHPTYFDSFGMVILEALAHGLPIIATNVYAIGEMVEHGKNGLLLNVPISIWSGTSPTALFSDTTKVRDAVRELDTHAFEIDLTNAMIQLAGDADLRTRAGQASLEIIRTRFAGNA